MNSTAQNFNIGDTITNGRCHFKVIRKSDLEGHEFVLKITPRDGDQTVFFSRSGQECQMSSNVVQFFRRVAEEV